MNTNIELLASDTILEAPIGAVEVGGETYQVMPPTTATLIAVSGLISLLPEIEKGENSENVLMEVLDKAKDCGHTLGQIAATLILGEKRIREQPMINIAREVTMRQWRWSKLRKVATTTIESIPVFERDHLTQQLISAFTPGELAHIVLAALATDSVADFFVLTTSLRTKSILTKTRTEVDETTASGALS